MTRQSVCIAFGALLAIAQPRVAIAQQYSPLTLGVDVTTIAVAREATLSQRLAGPVLGAQASVAFWRLHLEGRYAEGALTPDGGGAATEDFVDARLLALVRIAPWLSVGVAPHLRAFIAESGTARWSRVEAVTRIESELVNGIAHLRIDTWYAVSAQSNVQDGGNGALGGEVGLLLRIPRAPASLHVSYIADHATFANGGTESFDGIRAALVLDRILPARGARAGPARATR
jgi:hypothetical protein